MARAFELHISHEVKQDHATVEQTHAPTIDVI